MKHDHLFVPAISALELAAIVQILSDIRDFMGVPPQAFFESVAFNGVTIKGRITNMELREGQQVDLSVALKTASGHPAAYEKGSATWVSSAPDVVSVTVNPDDELKGTAKGLDGSANASALITFQVDGDPDAGPDQQRMIIATLDLVCTQGEATVAEITAGTPVDSPPA